MQPPCQIFHATHKLFNYLYHKEIQHRIRSDVVSSGTRTGSLRPILIIVPKNRVKMPHKHRSPGICEFFLTAECVIGIFSAD